jgi:hypothetical protein
LRGKKESKLIFDQLLLQLHTFTPPSKVMSRPHANSVDADNAWGKPITPSTEEGEGEDVGLDASDVVEKDRLVK